MQLKLFKPVIKKAASPCQLRPVNRLLVVPLPQYRHLFLVSKDGAFSSGEAQDGDEEGEVCADLHRQSFNCTRPWDAAEW